jgi:adenine/guanine phosphoribosyltransferase-like PRPP-binding protein
VDDIIATGKIMRSSGRMESMANFIAGGSAGAAGKLVEQLGGNLVGFLFILELDFLKGRDKLTAPVHTLLTDDVMGK